MTDAQRIGVLDFIDECRERRFMWWKYFCGGVFFRFIKSPVYLYNGGWSD